ncbi:hypothetical protein TNCV_1285141 [Trichonephila clavipes]|uniref:Uncharacterized protein n=1 Tax=Trichonephila clavipes TaxID=2585209 RepID=A0A8X6SLF1_TRICX|nr:hypothetical protein TNCV_1285141 [Trichonephila clavipes]
MRRSDMLNYGPYVRYSICGAKIGWGNTGCCPEWYLIVVEESARSCSFQSGMKGDSRGMKQFLPGSPKRWSGKNKMSVNEKANFCLFWWNLDIARLSGKSVLVDNTIKYKIAISRNGENTMLAYD